MISLRKVMVGKKFGIYLNNSYSWLTTRSYTNIEGDSIYIDLINTTSMELNVFRHTLCNITPIIKIEMYNKTKE